MSAESANGRHVAPLRAVETRFLFAFHFAPGRAEAASAALESASVVGTSPAWVRHSIASDGSSDAAVARAPEPPLLYREEILHLVKAHLFDGSTTAACRYLRLAPPVIERLWKGALVALGDGTEVPVVPAGAGVEMFLTKWGVGVLSITLAAPRDTLRPEQALLMNYRLAQRREDTAARLRIPHPSDDAAAWARMPAEQASRVRPAPKDGAPAAERIGVRGGRWTFPEVLDLLLEPLRSAGLDAKPAQDLLHVYTVLRFGAATDLADAATRDGMGPLLSAGAQLEEPGHAGAPSGPPPVPSALLNRRHWAAAGTLAAAHLVCDQPAPAGKDEHPFDPERAARARDKYFIPYVLALLERLTLDRVVRDVATALVAPDFKGAARDERLQALHREILEFSASGHHAHVSHRDALDRWFDTVRAGLRVETSLEAARRATHDIDAVSAAARAEQIAAGSAKNIALLTQLGTTQEALSRSMAATHEAQHKAAGSSAKSLAALVHMQSLVELIEVFLVSVYAAHLTHMVVPEHTTAHWAIRWDVLGAAIVGALGMWFGVRLWTRRGHPRAD